MKMNRTNLLRSAVRQSLAPACLLCVTLVPAVSYGADTISAALTEGKVSVDVRARYENVKQDNALDDANAYTIRTRLGYGTGSYQGASAYMEFSNTTAPGNEDYNSTTNGNTKYSVVADPELTEVDQSYLAYEYSGTVAKFGRQRILLDNVRWVGNVGWRQNEQTYDAFSIVNTSVPDTKITLVYVTNVNRIFGDDRRMKSPLLNVSYNGLSAGSLTGYAYMLDYNDFPGSSTQTTGLRFTGSSKVGDNAVLYTLEYAKQSDYGDNTASFDLNYELGEIGGTVSGWTAKVGYEVLEGDGTNAVQTPLATLHAHNGWADQFLSTPSEGLQDTYFNVGTKLSGVKLLAVYHDFSADNTSTKYGTEIDFVASKHFGKMYALTGKYADYSADNYSVDTKKLWLMGEVKF